MRNATILVSLLLCAVAFGVLALFANMPWQLALPAGLVPAAVIALLGFSPTFRRYLWLHIAVAVLVGSSSSLLIFQLGQQL
jgi:membrane protein YdbS with pleckstrin-like domain